MFSVTRHCTCMLSGFSYVWLFASLWTVAHQAPLFMGFSRQEYWSGLPCPPPGDLPDLGIEPMSLPSLALVGGFFTISATQEDLESLLIFNLGFCHWGNLTIFYVLDSFSETINSLCIQPPPYIFSLPAFSKIQLAMTHASSQAQLHPRITNVISSTS